MEVSKGLSTEHMVKNPNLQDLHSEQNQSKEWQCFEEI